MAVVAMVVGTLLLIAAVVVTNAALALISTARGSRRWPTAPGRVVRSEARGIRDVIRYRYPIQGEEFEGTDVTLGGWPYPSARTAAERVRRYPTGTQVTVYYDPRHPTTLATLEPGFSLGVLYLPAVSSALLLVALALLSWSVGHLLIR